MLIGIAGCVIPGLPGIPISYAGIVMLYFIPQAELTWVSLIVWGIVTAVVTVLDYVIPAWGTKKYGGSKRGVWGSVIGLFVGMFCFPPLGIIVGPFLGAVLGELTAGKEQGEALRSGWGSFIGMLLSTVLKLIVAGLMLMPYITTIYRMVR